MVIFEKLVDGIYLIKSDAQFRFKCNGILIKDINNSGKILIDCNFSENEIKELYRELNNQIDAYFCSHTHLDHVNNIQIYEYLGIKIYCPIPEDKYLLDMNNFLLANGAIDFGVADLFSMFIHKFLEFKELKFVIGFDPGTEFKFGNIILKTIHIPGHSPGHTAYQIENEINQRRKILFASDIGIEKYGVWYGFKYCNLKVVRNSIKKLENIYLNDDFILTSGHSPTFFEKQPEIFNDILKKIEQNEKKVLNMFDKKIPKRLKDVALKGFFYNLNAIPERMKKIYYLWEGYMILNHIHELVEEGKLIEIGNQQWILG